MAAARCNNTIVSCSLVIILSLKAKYAELLIANISCSGIRHVETYFLQEKVYSLCLDNMALVLSLNWTIPGF